MNKKNTLTLPRNLVILSLLLYFGSCCFINSHCDDSTRPVCQVHFAKCGCNYDSDCEGVGVCQNNKCQCKEDDDCEDGICSNSECIRNECSLSADCISSKRPSCIYDNDYSYKTCGCLQNSDCTKPFYSKCFDKEAICVECLEDSDCSSNKVCGNEKRCLPRFLQELRLLGGPTHDSKFDNFFLNYEIGVPYWSPAGSNGWIGYWTASFACPFPTVWVSTTGTFAGAYTASTYTTAGAYATIAAALTAIGAAATPSAPIMLYVGSGSYAVAVALPPNVYLIGAGAGATNINGAVTISAAWSSTTLLNTGGILFATIGLTGSLSVDFSIQTSSYGKFYLYSSIVSGSGGTAVKSFTSNNYVYTMYSTFGAVTQTGLQMYNMYSSIGAITIVDQSAVSAYHYCSNGVYTSTMIITSSNAGKSAILYNYNCPGVTTLTATQSGTASITIYAVPGMLPSSPSTSGVVQFAYLLNENNNIYNPSNPSLWTPKIPTDTQSALDNVIGAATSYNPAVPANWLVLPSTYASALDFLSAGSYYVNTVYVTSGATGGNGKIFSPYGTITTALAGIGSTTTITLLYVGPGTYAESVALPQNVVLIGSGTESTIISGAVTIGAVTTASSVIVLQSVSIITTAPSLSLSAVSVGVSLYLKDVKTALATTIAGYTTVCAYTQSVTIKNCQLAALTITDISSSLYSNTLSGLLTISTVSCGLTSGPTPIVSTIQSGFGTSASILATAGKLLQVTFNGISLSSSLTVNSAVADLSLTASSDSIPTTTTFSGTFVQTSMTMTTGSNAIYYRPTNANDWSDVVPPSGSPTVYTVQTALDALAPVQLVGSVSGSTTVQTTAVAVPLKNNQIWTAGIYLISASVGVNTVGTESEFKFVITYTNGMGVSQPITLVTGTIGNTLNSMTSIPATIITIGTAATVTYQAYQVNSAGVNLPLSGTFAPKYWISILRVG
jgi:hypothetical protein